MTLGVLTILLFVMLIGQAGIVIILGFIEHWVLDIKRMLRKLDENLDYRGNEDAE